MTHIEQQKLSMNTEKELAKPQIKTIVFDVGNVLVNAPTGILVEKIAEKLGIPKEEMNAFFTAYDKPAMGGKMSEEEYLQRLYAMSEIPMPENLEEARQVFQYPELYSPVEGMQALVKELQRNPSIQIRVLSDIEPPLKPLMLTKLQEYYPSINPETVFFSCDIKASKAEEGSPAFEELLKRLGNPDPVTVFFTDDKKQFVDNGQVEHGIKTFHFHSDEEGVSPSQRLRHELEKAGVLTV